jgi:hypothetical protein
MIMMALENPKFDSLTDMMAYIRSLTVADKRKILRGYGYDVDSIDSTRKLELLADYIVQGLHRGIKGKELVSYANNMSSGVIALMPYFGKPDNAPSVAKSDKTEVVTNKTLPVAKPAKVAKSLPVAKKTKSKVKHPDFTIVFRADRNGYEGWYGGKAEAFRDNVEKVQSFFQKKYGQTGNLI